MSFHVATITSPAYWPQTQAMAESLRRVAPGVAVHVLLVEDGRRFAPPALPPCLILHSLKELDLPVAQLHVRFSLFELACALKPVFLRYLFDRLDVDALAYIDSDILFFQPPAFIEERLRDCDILLTPHFAAPADSTGPGLDQRQLAFGAYNLGFLGLRRCDNVRAFLDWWAERTLRFCTELADRGVYTDQRWLDLVPGLFANVRVERHPGLNVAHWNLAGRALDKVGTTYTVNGQPLIFFHFSWYRPGLDIREYSWGHSYGPALDAILAEYDAALLANGYSATAPRTAPLDCLPNGARISPVVRSALREVSAECNGHAPSNVPSSPQEAVRQAVRDRHALGSQVRIAAYHHFRAGTIEDLARRYRSSRWFRARVNIWFYFSAPHMLDLPVEWVEPGLVRRGLRACVGLPLALARRLFR